jgi:transcription-repair coupling factor (superfamily II helicase)
VLYKRIANAETEEDLRKLKIEMIDRFGLLPDQVKALFAVTELKQHASHLGIKKMEAHSGGGRIVFGSSPHINTVELISLIQTQAKIYKFDGADKLRFTQTLDVMEEKVTFLHSLLEKLSPQ